MKQQTIFGLILLLIIGFSSCKKDEETQLEVSDVDGNIYNSVVIGNQVWMKENLKTTHYRDGSEIFHVTESPAWDSLKTGAYCYYDNNIANFTTYGCLYNWYAVVDIRNICPTGWHVPSDSEWSTLTNHLGGESVSGGKLKEEGTMHWEIPNIGATNEAGFTALPSGLCMNNNLFAEIGTIGIWWSSTEGNYNIASWGRELFFDYAYIGRYNYYKSDGMSVRCLKN